MTKNPYEFLGLLGAGAMGQVHLVRETSLMRHVAFKLLLRQMANHPQTLRRFLNEMQITAQLDHPYIVPIYSLENTVAGPAYTMKLVEGKTLKELLQQAREVDKPVALQNTMLEYFQRVCEAMDFAHRKGVIHRDLKPANIMIGPYREVYVMDWGIARVMGQPQERAEDWVQLSHALSDDTDATQVGQILGTPRYMSPEQAKGRNNELDGRSDVFALGAILFEIVTLQPAFKGKTAIEMVKKILSNQREPFRHLKPPHKIPLALQAIVNKALAPKCSDRYGTAGDLLADLQRFLRGEAVSACRDTWLQKGLRWLNRNREKVLVTVLTTIVITVSVLLGLFYRQHLQQLAARQREQRLQTVFQMVLAQSRLIDRYFLQVEKQLDAFSAVVAATLTRGLPEQTFLYRHNGLPPPDFKHSSYYEGAISLDYAINIPASQLPKGLLEQRMQQLSPLRHYFKRMLIRSTQQNQRLTPLQERHLIAETGVPVMWGTTVLKEGLAHWYPGKDLGFDTFDPRTRPYYTSAAYRYGHFWGTPYIDGTGSGMLLSCSSGLYDENNRFLGTTSLDLKIDYIIKTLMKLPVESRIQASYLVNQTGHVLVSSMQAGQRYQAKVYPLVKLKQFHNEQVVRAILQRRTGYLQSAEENAHLYYFARIPAVNWYLVTVSGAFE